MELEPDLLGPGICYGDSPLTVFLGTLVLNELEWLPQLYAQHKDWPGLLRWVFVEAADRAYAAANPDMVSADGLSVDGTTEWLEELAKADDRVTHIKHGFTRDQDVAQGKCQARNRYLELTNLVRPDVVITLDADEFYTQDHQLSIADQFRSNSLNKYLGLIFLRREVWRPPSCTHLPLFSQEVVGGFWAIPCCHWWRWQPGMAYAGNHNNPKQADGRAMPMVRLDRGPQMDLPQMVHLGFAATAKTRLAKNRYYQERGEGVTDHRRWYVDSRSAWRDWLPGALLPAGASVIPYKGPVPGVFCTS